MDIESDNILIENIVKDYQTLCKNLLDEVQLDDIQYECLILRDYHIDNLFYLENEKGVQQCGLIDFQDGLWGPCGYDFVSLVNDARIDVPQPLKTFLEDRYFSLFPASHQKTIYNRALVMDFLRHLRIIGVFHRLHKRDGKPQYLQYLPRLWGYVNAYAKNPLFKEIFQWLSKHYS